MADFGDKWRLMMIQLVFALMLLTQLAACASPRSRIAEGLKSLGVPGRPARCVADEMDRQLDGQRLGAVADLLEGARRAGEIEPSRRNLRRGVDVLTRAGDPVIADTAVRASVACLILG
jgi:hypothetical protein